MEKEQQRDCVECGRFCFDNQPCVRSTKIAWKKTRGIACFFGSRRLQHRCRKKPEGSFYPIGISFQDRIEGGSRKSRGMVEELQGKTDETLRIDQKKLIILNIVSLE